MGGPQDIPNTDSEPGKAKWWAKGNQKDIPHKSDSNHHQGMNLSQCVSIHTYCPLFSS